MSPLIVAMPGNDAMALGLATALGAELGRAEVRRFPDGESSVRIESPVDARAAAIVCTLDRPDDKLVPLQLLAAAMREAGAASIGLVAPYLAYMRQDRAFQPGETASARHVASWLSQAFDSLVTVDPHLHRIAHLSQIYTIDTAVVHAAPALARWVRANVQRPLLIGPDEESAQWVADVAQRADVPHLVLDKVRHGDREVDVRAPSLEGWRAHTPVLVDDILSTGRTMVQAAARLRAAGLDAPVCVAVHAVFADGALDALREQHVADVVTCDTIVHATNRISLVADIASALGSRWARLPAGNRTAP